MTEIIEPAPSVYLQLELPLEMGLVPGSLLMADLCNDLLYMLPSLLEVMRSGRGWVKLEIERGRIIACPTLKDPKRRVIC